MPNQPRIMLDGTISRKDGQQPQGLFHFEMEPAPKTGRISNELAIAWAALEVLEFEIDALTKKEAGAIVFKLENLMDEISGYIKPDGSQSLYARKFLGGPGEKDLIDRMDGKENDPDNPAPTLAKIKHAPWIDGLPYELDETAPPITPAQARQLAAGDVKE